MANDAMGLPEGLLPQGDTADSSLVESSHRPRHAIGSPAAFRPQAKEYALHPLEKSLAIVVIVLLVFLPWALGGMKLWAQQIAFGLAALAFVLALIPRTYDDRYHAGGNLRLYMWPKLLRFPIFWLGLDDLTSPSIGQDPLYLLNFGRGCSGA